MLYWLRWLVIVGVLPAWVVTALTINASYQRERVTLERSTVATAHALSEAVDHDLESATAAMQVLAMSPYLASGDIAAFYRQAREALSNQSGNVIVLVDPSGQQIMSTIKSYGEKLPRAGATDMVRAVLETARPMISDFYIETTSKEPQVAVGVPVIRDGKVIDVLMMGILPQDLSEVLHSEQLPRNWVAAIVDAKGTIVARTHAPDQFVGQKGEPALLRRLKESWEGSGELATLEGTSVLAAFSRSYLSGWTVAIGIPIDELTADLHVRLWWDAAAAGVVFLLALLLAQQTSLRIARSIQALRRPALALASDAPIVIPPIEIAEVAEVGRAIASAGRLLEQRTNARDQAERKARAHLAELAHVSRVSLAGEMVAGIAHELSQPLTAIGAYGQGCLRLLAAPTCDAEMLKEGVRGVVQQAERAGEVLIRLRDFVRQGASRRRFVAVRPLIDAAVALIAFEAAHVQVEIAVQVDPNLPLVFADDIQIEQVILNLLRNSMDAMICANVTHARAVVAAHGTANGTVEISVTDNGPGVGDASKENIFQPFVTTKPWGMGMGLSISRTIVEAHGAELRLAPSQSAGATFTFELPTTAIGMQVDAQ